MNLKISLLANCSFWLLVVASHAQSQSFSPNASLEMARRAKPAQWAWTQKPWQTDDRAFARLQSEVAKAGATQKNWPKLATTYERIWLKKKDDPQAFFRFALANYEGAIKGHTSLKRRLPALLNQFQTLPSPSSYRYNRLRYLMEVSQFAKPELKTVVRRLLKRQPNDADVLYSTVNLWNLVDSQERQEAQVVAAKLLQIDPKRPSTHAYAAWLHFRLWRITNQKQEARASIAAYRKYLQMAPANDAFRPQAQRIIAMMQKS